MSIGRDAIARLLPHAGSMCLLETVVAWDGNSIACRATSHRDPANPLRSAGGLSAITGVEYAAQTAAVHWGLLHPSTPCQGYLASLRDVECFAERLDSEAGELSIHAAQVAAESGRLLYDFRIEAAGRVLLKGRLSVVLVKE